MKRETVSVVRAYLAEADRAFKALLRRLHDEAKGGVRVFRAASGFGGSGVVHPGSLPNLRWVYPSP